MSEKPRNSIEEFGQELVNARNFKNMSVEQISDMTKVAIRYLQAMEEGEWDALPRPYMEVFLRAYAEAVGMNVPKVMKKYREMVQKELVTAEQIEGGSIAEETEPSYIEEPIWGFPFTLKTKIYIGAGLVVILLAAAILLFGSGKEKPGDVTAEKSGTAFQDTAGTMQLVSPTERPETGAEETSGVQRGRTDLAPSTRQTAEGCTLLVRARENCWLQATIDRSEVRDMYLRPDDEVTLSAEREIHLVVGNAGGLELEVGGEVKDTLGPANKPVTLVVDHEGIVSQRLGAWRLDFSGQVRPASSDSASN